MVIFNLVGPDSRSLLTYKFSVLLLVDLAEKCDNKPPTGPGELKTRRIPNKNTMHPVILFDCCVDIVLAVEIGVKCRQNTVVLCYGIFFLVQTIFAGSNRTINLKTHQQTQKSTRERMIMVYC